MAGELPHRISTSLLVPQAHGTSQGNVDPRRASRIQLLPTAEQSVSEEVSGVSRLIMASMQRVAIFGSGGQLGVELKSEFSRRGWQVVAFERSKVDITDPAAVEQALANADPSVVVNSAAYNQVDVAEKEPVAAYQANALAVRNLALACRQIDARLIHFSTDYVFDGRAGRAYTEEDETHPLGAYAVSKLAGELYARAYVDSADRKSTRLNSSH